MITSCYEHARPFCLWYILLLFPFTALHARIGWTPEQCRQKYGHETGSDGDTMTFTVNDFDLWISFSDGKVACIKYAKASKDETNKGLTPEECQELVRRNCPELHWMNDFRTDLPGIDQTKLKPSQQPELGARRGWISTDATVLARSFLDGDENLLIIFTKSFHDNYANVEDPELEGL
jgi:hypothetical protein